MLDGFGRMSVYFWVLRLLRRRVVLDSPSCESTAPTPYAEASVARKNGLA